MDRSAAADHVLVVVELSGGNDGLSTLVPIDDDGYRSLRPDMALGDDEVVEFADGWALNASLEPLLRRNLAIVGGVGAAAGTMSHFDMLSRWWTGTPGTTQRDSTGFLGRLADELDAGSGPTAVSIGLRPSPAVRSAGPTTTTLPAAHPLAADVGGSPTAGSALVAVLEQFGGLAVPGASQSEDLARSYQALSSLDAMVAGLPPASPSLAGLSGPAANFAHQLGFAAQLIAGSDVRVVHLDMGGADFDTHAHHRERHRQLMEILGTGLDVFHEVLVELGVAQDVLIATTSEFGRRVAQNGTGLDHGAGSCALLLGPVVPGLHGDPPPLDRLDEHGNLPVAVDFDRYQAVMASWLGVEPAKVLGSAPSPLDGLLAT